MLVAGVDGTKAGWVTVLWDGQASRAFPLSTLAEIFEIAPDVEAIAIDMPIGFLDAAERGGRTCERQARALMPGRGSSVFNSPVRAALEAGDYAMASALNAASSALQLGLSKQSFALFPKLREVEQFIQGVGQDLAFEVHPELSFTHLAKQGPNETRLESKHSLTGLMQRIELLSEEGMDPRPLLANRRALKAGDDDILDAVVAAWTAWRRARGEAQRFPEDPPKDSLGLLMEIWA
jgi:predicted RNase H-like nuclease